MDIFLTHRSPVLRFFNIIRSIEILTVNERVASVLLTSEITDEGERIVRLVLVGRSLCARTDDYDGEKRESDHDHREAQKHSIGKYLSLFHCTEKSPEAKAQEQEHEECRTAIERKMQGIDKEEVEICRKLRKIRDDSEKNHGQYHHGNQEDLHILLE